MCFYTAVYRTSCFFLPKKKARSVRPTPAVQWIIWRKLHASWQSNACRLPWMEFLPLPDRSRRSHFLASHSVHDTALGGSDRKSYKAAHLGGSKYCTAHRSTRLSSPCHPCTMCDAEKGDRLDLSGGGKDPPRAICKRRFANLPVTFAK